jgi:hypothetical protein
MRRRRTIGVVASVVLLGATIAILLFLYSRQQPITITGAVLRQDVNPSKRTPITDADITAAIGTTVEATKSDPSGFFHLRLRPNIKTGQKLTLTFEHSGYEPLTLTEQVANRLYIAEMTPSRRPVSVTPSGPPINIAHVTVRYTLRKEMTESIGAAVRAIEVVNAGNVPCNGHLPCSPDGKWKASVVSVMLDAGEGNQFRQPSVSCIAGPCPFTRIDVNHLSDDGRTLKVSVRDWSDTATFLVQAEVMRAMSEDLVRRLYPVIFSDELNFTLPADAEGPSFEAEVNGNAIVFPLGPDLCLSWANCHVRTEQDHATLYTCELKPGYQFR